MRQLKAASLALVAALGLTGCTSDGLSSHLEGGFESCLEGAGVDLSGVDDWSAEEERAALARPEALDCLLDEVPADDRREVLERAFPEEDGADQSPPEYGEVTESNALTVVAYVQAHGGEADVERVAQLLNALGWADYERDHGARRMVALSLTPGGSEGYQQWLTEFDRTDDAESMTDFVQEQTRQGTPLGQGIDRTNDQLYEAQRKA